MITSSNQNRSLNDRLSSSFAPLLANTIAATTVAFKCHSYSTQIKFYSNLTKSRVSLLLRNTPIQEHLKSFAIKKQQRYNIRRVFLLFSFLFYFLCVPDSARIDDFSFDLVIIVNIEIASFVSMLFISLHSIVILVRTYFNLARPFEFHLLSVRRFIRSWADHTCNRYLLSIC